MDAREPDPGVVAAQLTYRGGGATVRRTFDSDVHIRFYLADGYLDARVEDGILVLRSDSTMSPVVLPTGFANVIKIKPMRYV